MAPGDHRSGVPPVVSPRTSSNRPPPSHAASATDRSSRRTAYAADSSNSPRQASSGDGHRDRGNRQRSNGNMQTNGVDRDDPAATDARARRRAQQQSAEAIPHRPSGSREARTASASAVQRQAMATAGAQSPGGLSREASEVLNRVIIDDPEVDVLREQQRMAEATPSSPLTQSTTPGGLSVINSDGAPDSARSGGRSRHDHTTSGKSSKNSKFGDYFLGNTLGEGEFGKVKMGWKQEGGQQVRYSVFSQGAS